MIFLLLLLRTDAPPSQNLPVESKHQGVSEKTTLPHIVCCNQHYLYFHSPLIEIRLSTTCDRVM